jgi:hypothetical protein
VRRRDPESRFGAAVGDLVAAISDHPSIEDEVCQSYYGYQHADISWMSDRSEPFRFGGLAPAALTGRCFRFCSSSGFARGALSWLAQVDFRCRRQALRRALWFEG